MTQVSNNNYQANYGSAIGTATIGGAAWGLGQYFFNKRPFIDHNENFSDVFVKNLEEALVGANDSAAIKNIELQKGLEKEIDALVNIEDVKTFISDKQDDFMRIAGDDVKIINEEIGKMEINEGKAFAKDLFKKDGKYRKFYNSTVSNCYDDAGKLIHNTEKISKESFEAVKKVVNKSRINSALKAAGLFTLICGACCCIFEFFASRKKN